MTRRSLLLTGSALAAAPLLPARARAQTGPLRLEITEGVIEPLPFAIPPSSPATAARRDAAADITRVIAADLRGTGLFRQIPDSAHISTVTSFDAPIQYDDWQAINAQALIIGEVEESGDRLTVRFRLFDVFSGQPLGEGLQFVGARDGWRRMAHNVAASGLRADHRRGLAMFDTRVVFVHEEGPKNARLKRHRADGFTTARTCSS